MLTRSLLSIRLRVGQNAGSWSRWKPIWIVPVRSARWANRSLPKSRIWPSRPATVAVAPIRVSKSASRSATG